MPNLRCWFFVCSLVWGIASSRGSLGAGALPGEVVQKALVQDKFDWHDAQELSIHGQGWEELKSSYARLPAKAEGMAPAEVWRLSRHSSGVYVQFISNSTKIKVKWRVRGNNNLNHMAPTAVKGVDLYARTPQGWQWVGVGKPSGKENEAELVSSMAPGEREFRLYLPLYDGVDSVQIGVEKGTTLKAAAAEQKKPIVFYGTSITQGACATRAGMAYPSIIGRELNRETVNLGFSGSGKMELEMAQLLSEVEASLYVLDCLPNLKPEEVESRAVAFVKLLRAKRPDTPILLVENIDYAHTWIDTRVASIVKTKNAHVQKAYQALQAAGIKGVYYRSSKNLALEGGEGTVDGIHLTDLGFAHLAEELSKDIKKIIKKTKE